MAEKDGAGPSRDLLLNACRIGLLLPAGSKSDEFRFGKACARYLSVLHELEDFAAGDLFLDEFKHPLIERLKVNPLPSNPWQVEADLARRYNSQH
jgi:hypothetical protein